MCKDMLHLFAKKMKLIIAFKKKVRKKLENIAQLLSYLCFSLQLKRDFFHQTFKQNCNLLHSITTWQKRLTILQCSNVNVHLFHFKIFETQHPIAPIFTLSALCPQQSFVFIM